MKIEGDEPKVEIIFKDRKADEEAAVVQFAIMKFTNEQVAIKYYHTHSKDLKLLPPRQIVQLINSAAAQKPESPSK